MIQAKAGTYLFTWVVFCGESFEPQVRKTFELCFTNYFHGLPLVLDSVPGVPLELAEIIFVLLNVLNVLALTWFVFIFIPSLSFLTNLAGLKAWLHLISFLDLSFCPHGQSH